MQKPAYQSEARLYDDQAFATHPDDRIAATSDGTCRIGRLVVLPRLQGRGIGTQLMRRIEREFPQTHTFESFTGSRSAGNIRLYERLGYVRAREQPPSPALTPVFMEKHR